MAISSILFFTNLIPFLPKDQRRLRKKRHVVSEDRKLKTEPATGHSIVSLGKLVRTVPISTLQRFCHLGNDKIGEDNNYKYFGV
jgi:hypothetical protein